MKMKRFASLGLAVAMGLAPTVAAQPVASATEYRNREGLNPTDYNSAKDAKALISFVKKNHAQGTKAVFKTNLRRAIAIGDYHKSNLSDQEKFAVLRMFLTSSTSEWNKESTQFRNYSYEKCTLGVPLVACVVWSDPIKRKRTLAKDPTTKLYNTLPMALKEQLWHSVSPEQLRIRSAAGAHAGGWAGASPYEESVKYDQETKPTESNSSGSSEASKDHENKSDGSMENMDGGQLVALVAVLAVIGGLAAANGQIPGVVLPMPR